MIKHHSDNEQTSTSVLLSMILINDTVQLIQDIKPSKTGIRSFIQRLVKKHPKGMCIRCDLYQAILLYYHNEIKEMIYESVNLKGVVYN